MAILKIARMGHPVLAAPAAPVADPTAPEVRRLVEDMVDTLADAGGVGLAAPQVHVPLRVVIFHVPPARAGQGEGEGPQPLTVLINPVVEPLGEEKAAGWEGCLSLPGMMGEVPRHVRVRYRALGLDGRPVEWLAAGFHARVVQHECDHLDGILYPRRIVDFSRFGFVEEIRRRLTAAEAAAAAEGAE
jgi:peptide deformylase